MARSPFFRPILFDLDGTLADTQPGIVTALARAMAEEGWAALTPEQVHPLTGRGERALVAGAMRHHGQADEDMIDRVTRRYVVHYAELCAVGSSLYPGLDGLLDRLPGPLALLTNKPRRFTDIIVERLGLSGRFDVVIAGDDPGAERKPSPWGIQQALRRIPGGHPRPVFVADSVRDAQAGRAAGVPTCMVGWGYGQATTSAEATYAVATPEQLEQLLWSGAVGSPTPAA